MVAGYGSGTAAT
jgi:hypothetical protein